MFLADLRLVHSFFFTFIRTLYRESGPENKLLTNRAEILTVFQTFSQAIVWIFLIGFLMTVYLICQNSLVRISVVVSKNSRAVETLGKTF